MEHCWFPINRSKSTWFHREKQKHLWMKFLSRELLYFAWGKETKQRTDIMQLLSKADISSCVLIVAVFFLSKNQLLDHSSFDSISKFSYKMYKCIKYSTICNCIIIKRMMWEFVQIFANCSFQSALKSGHKISSHNSSMHFSFSFNSQNFKTLWDAQPFLFWQWSHVFLQERVSKCA